MTVRGASLTPEIEAESGYHREMLLERDRLPDFTSYNALGHIHLTQSVSAAKPSWYSGSPERVNLGERSYSPCVLLVTTPDTPGGEAAVRKLLLQSPTPFIDEELIGVAAVEAFSARGLPDPLGELRLTGVPMAERGAVEADLRRVAPRIGIRWQRDETPQLPEQPPRIDPLDVPHFVHTYLESEYADRPEKRARLAAAFDVLWSEEEGAA
jgi:DNA repair exonuclease SbcCD nuclease subunit